MEMRHCLALLVLLIATFCFGFEDLNLDRDEIRQSILQYRARRSIEQQEFSPRLRVRRQLPIDDEDSEGSGEDADDGREPEPPTEEPAIEDGGSVRSDWVWYRTKINFLDSIEYTSELTDFHTEAFHSLSEKIMIGVEDYLRTSLPGYHEATPLMFIQQPTGHVHVMVDVGACSSNSRDSIERAMRSLLRMGRIGDFTLSEDDFSMKEIGRDKGRAECVVSKEETKVTTTSTAEYTTTTTTTTRGTTTTRWHPEPTPPDTPPPRSCDPETQSTCRNGQCIGRHLICDGDPDCADGSDELTCGVSSECDPTEMLCPGTGICVQKMWKCDGDDDCGDGYDELSCPTAAPGSNCRGIEFECASDSICVPASYQCDGENDCRDISDEAGCARPVVTRPPRKNVTVEVGGTVVLHCEATGVPTAVISWRLNWGNVGLPPRVTMSSSNGRGELIIKEARRSDQGAYTCEAINSQGSIFAIPDAVVTVTDGQPDQPPCPPGEYGMEEDNCRPCYCFGVTNECVPLKMQYDEIGINFDTPDDVGHIELRPAESEGADPTPASEPINRNQILVKPAARELQLIDLSKRFLAAAHYWSLPAQFLGAKINSYGGTLTFSYSYNNSYNFEPRPTNYSDVIIEGANGRTLVYHGKEKHPAPEIKHTRKVELEEPGWTTADGQKATREDMLSVLNNIDKLLLRTVYDNSMLSTGIGDVRMTIAQEGTSKTGEMAYDVEKCICPEGYEGLSCQYCAPGWERISVGPFVGRCERIIPEEECPEGYTGEDCRNCADGYEKYDGECLEISRYRCNEDGATGPAINRHCDCKTNVQGERCEQCKPGFFHLSKLNEAGCTDCFCMGITDQCESSDSIRYKIVPQYTEGDRFHIVNGGSTRRLQDVVSVRQAFGRSLLVADLRRQPRDVFYWVLPAVFTGNRISSYGGELRYTIEYAGGSRTIDGANIKITGNDVTLEYRSSNPVLAGKSTFHVEMVEEGWVLPDGRRATRGDFLMALADVESFWIRATYATDMVDTSIYDISLEAASARASGGRRAVEVEQCACPPGYQGSSCEDCADGYRRSTSGPYLGTCVRCSCNGHSDTCDEETGECVDCRHNTAGARCERCVEGFYGDPRIGTANDCRPCPCPLLPSRSDQPRVASCILDIDELPTCDECPPGYEGRNCDVCSSGFEMSELRSCRKTGTVCECDPHGSVDGTCDEDGQCRCKDYAGVEGPRCDSCKPSYFYFSVENTGGGCLPCFCMGVTTRCESSRYVRDAIHADFSENFGGFSLTNRRQSQHMTDGFRTRAGDTELIRTEMNRLPDDTYYWELPSIYLGNKVVSYGGDLSYSVSFTAHSSGISISEPDVILIGNDITLVANLEGVVEERRKTRKTVTFRESHWSRADGQPATREHLLMALADLDSLLIRASYLTSMSVAIISDVSMETANADILDGSEFAYEVEQCTCPDGYEGLSCEDCSPGYTRSSGGLYLGLCAPCQCNGRADSCDSETGECADCRENTIGSHCDSCAPGFYSMSIESSELYCTPCACPSPENSFSATCEYVAESRSLLCDACQEGYEGTRCENCAEGYEGNPRVPGGRCVRKRTDETPPIVSVTPSSLSVRDGNEAILRCDVTSSTPVEVRWNRVGRQLQGSAVIGDDGYSLTIPAFSRSDAGTYECVATNQAGTGRDTGVLSEARRREFIEVTVEEPTYRRLPTGSEVTFVCTAASDTMAYILYWTKQEGSLPRSRSTEFNGILHIRDLTEEDSGTYVCTGSSMYDVDRKTAELVVVRDSTAVKPSVTIEPARQVVREGEEAIFRCSADGTPPIRIEWRPAHGESMPENARIINGDLYLPTVSSSDSAIFYCRAYNPQGYAESTAVLDVTVAGTPPVVTVVTSTVVNAQVGDNIEMRCIATGLPRPLFSWRRVGEAGLPGNAEPRGGTLQLMNVKLSNHDTYVCTARNAFGDSSGAIIVNITSKGIVEKPVCKTDPEFLTAYVGSDTSVTCVPQGDPLPTVTWVRSDGRPLPSNARIEGNKLLLHEVKLDNAGKYICIATNPGGTTRSQMTLKVEDKSLPEVEIMPRDQQVVEVGQSASFTCRPTAGHPVEVTWSRTDRKPFTRGTTLDDGGVIRFSNVTQADGGSYLCIARNVVGFRETAALLSVIKRPMITVEPTTEVYLRRGSSITLRCNANGIPIPNVAWERVHMFGRGVAMTHYKHHSNDIRIRAEDVGKTAQYLCIARSAAGDARQKVTVTVGNRETVIPPELIVEKRIVSAALGRRVQLRCAASGYPTPEMEWTKKNGELPPESTQEDGVLTIVQTTEVSAGVYVCVAVNSGGRQSSESTLRIIIPPKLRIDPPGPVIRLPRGNSEVITCSAYEGTDPIAYEFNKVIGGLSDNVLTSGDRLQILSFDPARDAGAYTCVGRNQAGSSTAEVTLLGLDPPRVEISTSEVRANTGDGIEISCTSSDTDATITWTKDGTQLEDERVTVNGGILRVVDVSLADSGEYKCTALNKAGASWKSAIVLVLETPAVDISLAPSAEDIRIGTHFEIACTATGTPTPSVTITKDGEEVLSAENGRLVVEAAHESHSGTYRCTATSEGGTTWKEVAVDVQAPLMLSVIPDINVIETRSGEELAVSCVVKGTDLPVSWTRERGELPSSAAVVGSLLQVEKVSSEDGGTYICTADADGNTLQKRIKVIVQAYIPYFTQSPTSYLSLIGNEDFYRDLSITISFRPNSADGLLLYSYGTGGDYMSLVLVKGKVEFRYNVGSGDGVLVSRDAVQLSEWHTVTITRDGREGQLTVDRQDPVYGLSEGSFETLDLDQPLYVGGYPTTGDGLPAPLQFLGLDVGFYGCISQLIIGVTTIDLGASHLIVDRVGILRCKTCGTEDEGSPCQHGSACTESYSGPKGYTCGCSEEYVGPECQFRSEEICADLGVCGRFGSCTPDYGQELGYRCECHPGYSGPKCEQDEIERVEEPPVVTPSEATVDTTEIENSLDGIVNGVENEIPEATSFTKGSYMQLGISNGDPTQFDVSMRVKIRSLDDGLVLYNGGALERRRRDILPSDIFVSLAMLNGSLQFRCNCGSGLTILSSSRPVLNVGQWHTIHANRAHRHGFLEVDGVSVAKGESPEGGGHRAELDGPFFIGGVKFWDRIPDQVGVTAGLDGCIETVFVNGKSVSLYAPISSKNVERCKADIATPKATAPSTTQPTTTEDDLDFDGILFMHSGIPAGFSGSTAKFSGESFISFPSDAFSHDTVAEQFSLHFQTTDPDGLILLHGRSGGDFILLGLRDGSLEYMFKLGSTQRKAVSPFPLSDGRWHNITVVRRDSLALMWIDELQFPVAVHAEGDLSRHLELGDLYIGGTVDVPMSTGDRYRQGFRGCIKNVKITALSNTDAEQVGATAFDDSRTQPFRFGSNQGRKSAKRIGRCRQDKTRTNAFN